MSSTGDNSRDSFSVLVGSQEQPPTSAIRSEPSRDLFSQITGSSRSARVLMASPSVSRSVGGVGGQQRLSADDFKAEWRKLGSEGELGAWKELKLNVRLLVHLFYC
jgi:hypothetical protein